MMRVPELHDTSRVRDDAETWNALAERVAANAIRASRSGAFSWFAHSRVSLVTAALASAAAILVTFVPADVPAPTLGVEWTAAVAPADELGRTLTLHESPPPIDALILGADGSESR